MVWVGTAKAQVGGGNRFAPDPIHREGAAMKGAPGACRIAVVEGEVKAGQSFERRLGNGLEAMLEPLASGWILRVLPYGEARGPHDYAELATPPYQSVNPLLVSTDFSFRAQDAVAWNPRRFHYAASKGEFQRLLAAYAEYMKSGASPAGQGQLAELAGRTPEGTLWIMDARLVPGTANQAQTAAMVATHLQSTAHSVEPAGSGKDTPLGRVTWLRFRMEFGVPRSAAEMARKRFGYNCEVTCCIVNRAQLDCLILLH
jgi:hypothetical protein